MNQSQTTLQEDTLEALLTQIFRAVLRGDEDVDVRTLVRGESESWDSLAHVLLISGVESEFGVQIDLDMALELNTFEDFLRLLVKTASGADTA